MQSILVFGLPTAWRPSHPDMDAGAWRSRWLTAGIGDQAAWNAQRVVATGDLLWVIAGSPDASAWLDRHTDAIAAQVADVAGDAVRLEARQRQVTLRFAKEGLWAYRIPRLVIEKGAGQWQPHFEVPLGQPLREKLSALISSGLRRELSTWGRLPHDIADPATPLVAIANPGRAYITKAISADRSGHGKPVSVLGRSNVIVLSTLRVEGDLFVGPLASLGYGRLLRTTPPDTLDHDVQRDLLRLPADEDTP